MGASGSSSASATASTAALCVFDKVEEYSGAERWQDIVLEGPSVTMVEQDVRTRINL